MVDNYTMEPGFPVGPDDVGRCPNCGGFVADNREQKHCGWCGATFEKFGKDPLVELIRKKEMSRAYKLLGFDDCTVADAGSQTARRCGLSSGGNQSA